MIDEEPDEKSTSNSGAGHAKHQLQQMQPNSTASVDLKCRERVTDSDIEDTGNDLRKSIAAKVLSSDKVFLLP